MNTTLPVLIQKFFTDRLCTQMEASPNTIAGYRDTFRLLLRFASERTGRAPTKLKVEDRSEEHTSELQSHLNLVCRLLLEKKKLHICHKLSEIGQTNEILQAQMLG